MSSIDRQHAVEADPHDTSPVPPLDRWTLAVDDPIAYAKSADRLIQAVRDLASARGIDEVVDIVRHAARQLVNSDGATFVLRDVDKCFYVDEDAIEPLWSGLRFPMETCISGWAMLNRQSVAISDIYADDRIPHDAYRPTFVKSLTMTPIRTTDPIGAIGTYWAEPHEATSTECRLLQALADSTAVALESVRVISELEQRVAERTAQLTMANSDLQQFASVAAHDLRNPIATMTGLADVLKAELGAPDGNVGAAVAGIERTGERLLSLIDGLLVFARTGATVPVSATVDLDDLARTVLADLDHAVAARQASVDIGPLGTVEADPSLLRQVLQNLVVNALTHGTDSVTPVIRIGADRARGSLALRVADNGPGVAPDDRERVFEPFVRGPAVDGRPGSGLGLAICRRIVTHHGGTLTVGEAPGGGAEFVIRLPDPAAVGRAEV